MSGLYILLPLTLPRQYGWGAARIALKVTAPSFFSALYCLTYSSSASWARLTAVSLSNPSAVPDRPTQAACAGAPRAKQKPAAMHATPRPSPTGPRRPPVLERLEQSRNPPRSMPALSRANTTSSERLHHRLPRYDKDNTGHGCLAVPLLQCREDGPKL